MSARCGVAPPKLTEVNLPAVLPVIERGPAPLTVDILGRDRYSWATASAQEILRDLVDASRRALVVA